jgi:hypothetical protein
MPSFLGVLVAVHPGQFAGEETAEELAFSCS